MHPYGYDVAPDTDDAAGGAWEPPRFFPRKEHLDYWKALLTTLLLALATPYLLLLLVRNPGKAASLSSAI